MPAIRLPNRGEHPPQKPAVGTPVNWAHPLARGLLLSCALNEAAGKTIADSITGRQFAVTGAGWEGSEFSLRAATGRVDISGLPCAINATSKWSLVLRSRGQANSGGAIPAVFASFNFDGGVNYWALAVQQYSNYLYLRGRFNNYGDFCGGSQLQAGPHHLDVPETIVLVVSGYTATVYRADGQSYSAQLGTSSDVSGGTITIGNTYDNTVYRRSIGLVQFYNRALTPDEADSILANPWQVYQPPRRLRPAEAGGGTSVVSSDLTLNWDMLNTIASDLALKWDIFATTASDLTLLWDIRDNELTSVSNDLALVWDAFAPVSSDLTLNWDTLQQVFSDLAVKWDVYQTVSGDLTILFDVRNLVESDLRLIWDAAGTVSSDLTLRWDLGDNFGRITIIGSSFRRLLG